MSWHSNAHFSWLRQNLKDEPILGPKDMYHIFVFEPSAWLTPRHTIEFKNRFYNHCLAWVTMCENVCSVSSSKRLRVWTRVFCMRAIACLLHHSEEQTCFLLLADVLTAKCHCSWTEYSVLISFITCRKGIVIEFIDLVLYFHSRYMDKELSVLIKQSWKCRRVVYVKFHFDSYSVSSKQSREFKAWMLMLEPSAVELK